MSTRTSNFEIAALEAAPAQDEDEQLLEVGLGAGVFTLWRQPTQGEWGLFTLHASRGEKASTAVVDELLEKILLEPEQVAEQTDPDGVSYAERVEAGEFVGRDWLWEQVGDRRVDFDLETLLTIFRHVITSFGGFPTKPSSGSTSSPRTSGPSSTASSRRVGSPRSRSRSAGSAT